MIVDQHPSAGPLFDLVFGSGPGIFPDVPEPHRAVDEPPAGWQAAAEHQLELEGSGKAGLGGTQRQGQDRWQSGRLDSGKLKGEPQILDPKDPKAGKRMGWTFPSTVGYFFETALLG